MKCAVCRKRFHPTRSDAKTCGATCRQRAHRRRLSVTKRVTDSGYFSNSVHFSSKTVEWPTPQSFFDKLDAEFRFTLDVCATVENAKCARFYNMADTALHSRGPYGRHVGLWLSKAREAASAGATVVALIPARPDTEWWHEVVTRASEVRFVRGRLRFDGAKHSAPFPSAVVVWRPPP